MDRRGAAAWKRPSCRTSRDGAARSVVVACAVGRMSARARSENCRRAGRILARAQSYRRRAKRLTSDERTVVSGGAGPNRGRQVRSKARQPGPDRTPRACGRAGSTGGWPAWLPVSESAWGEVVAARPGPVSLRRRRRWQSASEPARRSSARPDPRERRPEPGCDRDRRRPGGAAAGRSRAPSLAGLAIAGGRRGGGAVRRGAAGRARAVSRPTAASRRPTISCGRNGCAGRCRRSRVRR